MTVCGQSQGQKPKLSYPVMVVIALAVIFGISLHLRIALPHDSVFVKDLVWFTGMDAWYHMRLADNLLHNFPHRIFFDPYTFYPHGTVVSWPPFFDWLIVGVSWLVGLGSPSQQTLDRVGAYIPPIVGALTVFPVYIIGRELFNRWVGIIAAALVTILPGEFLHRSLLGFTDHHVAETLFSTVVIMFLILAVKRGKEAKLSFAYLRNKNWSATRMPLIYAALAGIFLGIYLLSWIGGLMFVFVVFSWLVIQFLVDHLRNESTVYLSLTGTVCLVVASGVSLPLLGLSWTSGMTRASLLIAALTPAMLGATSQFLSDKGMKPILYPAALAVLGALGLLIFWLCEPALLKSVLARFHIFAPSGTALTIQEVLPLTPDIAWETFTTSFFVSFVALGLVGYLAVREKGAEKTLFLVWSIIMLAAILGQRRFGYYYAVNAALLTGYFCWRMLDLAGLRKLFAKPMVALRAVERPKKKKGREKAEERARLRAKRERRALWTRVALAAVALFFLVLFPNISKAVVVAQEPGQMNVAWYESLLWLKENSPEPFGDPDFYCQLYQTPFKYPESAYGVMSWWDYGHWITRIAHRIPVCNPFQEGAGQASQYFIAQDEDSANRIMDKLDSRYVIIDSLMATAKFHSMATWAGVSKDEFYEVYYQAQEGDVLKGVTFFYPAYYRSTVVRLYNFDGKEVVPDKCTVICYEDRVTAEGVEYKLIVERKTFSSYEEAEAYVSTKGNEKCLIASPDPFISPVPLEEIKHYRLVHSSPQLAEGEPEVKIFEYVK